MEDSVTYGREGKGCGSKRFSDLPEMTMRRRARARGARGAEGKVRQGRVR